MGILRLILALAVVVVHAHEPKGDFLFNAASAVNSFFIISGFYMALILDGKYHDKIVFYTNRFLRIFPLYIIVLLITLGFGLIKTFLHLGSDETAITHYIHYSAFLTGYQVIIEAVNFISRNLTLIITKDYFSMNDNLAPGYLIVNQAWSLQIELLFYLIVPFILKLKRDVIFLVVIFCLIFYGIIKPFSLIQNNTLTYNFLSVLIFFFLGIMSYRFVYKKIQAKKISKLIMFFTFSVLFAYIIFYQFLPIKLEEFSYPISLTFYVPFAIAISYIFEFTKNNKLDRFVGELSYPVYITHMIFVKIIFSLHVPPIQYLNSILITIPTLIFSIFLVKFVQNPIDHFRHHQLKTKNLKHGKF